MKLDSWMHHPQGLRDWRVWFHTNVCEGREQRSRGWQCQQQREVNMVKPLKGARFYLWKSSHLSLGLVRRRMLVLPPSLMVGGERELVFSMYDLILVKKKKNELCGLWEYRALCSQWKGSSRGHIKGSGRKRNKRMHWERISMRLLLIH